MAQRDVDILSCGKCASTWMEQVAVYQFKKDHNVILTQAVPAKDDIGFFVLRCIKCGEIYEPNVQVGARDTLRKKYDSFLDSMEDVPEVKTEGDPV